jgi:hypothetical protein
MWMRMRYVGCEMEWVVGCMGWREGIFLLGLIPDS